MSRSLLPYALPVALVACSPPDRVLGEGDNSTSTTTVGEAGETIPDIVFDVGAGHETGCDVDLGCKNQIDLLFVIDNSGTMGEEQLNLAKNFPLLIEQLDNLVGPDDQPVGVDVNIMVTTTDFGNPKCSDWEKDDYDPAKGAPISKACTERIERFTGLGMNPDVVEEACYEVCDPDNPVSPDDQFIHFDPDSNNIPTGSPAQALACIGPQGIDGCGYESPLETMLQGLNTGKCWNNPDDCEDPAWSFVEKPFLRTNAVLAVVIITDEADCSIKRYEIMDDSQFMEVDPVSGMPALSSAICWNAGTRCDGLDPQSQVYADCVATDRALDGTEVDPPFAADEPALQPITRYIDHLQILKKQGKEVIMLGILGVPEVTAHAELPPHNPIAGGVMDLEYHPWRPEDVPPISDETAEELQADFGIGPGCAEVNAAGDGFDHLAAPPARIKEVCESLNEPDRVRCCIESICDDDFSDAIRCLTGILQDVIDPVE